MRGKTVLVWFRNDLRFHDNAAIDYAASNSDEWIPLYCLDVQDFEKNELGFPRTSVFRAQFLLECVADLRTSLRMLGSDLVIREGYPHDVIPELVRKHGISEIITTRTFTHEEILRENLLFSELEAAGVKVTRIEGATLVHPDDLPFAETASPEFFPEFRDQFASRGLTIRNEIAEPEDLPDLVPIETGELPKLRRLAESFGLPRKARDPRAVLWFQGGEAAGLTRIDEYLFDKDRLRNYKDTRDGLMGPDFSTKFSAWLSFGCLSPRRVYNDIKRYEKERVANDSTNWAIFELLRRDYYKYLAARHGDGFYHAQPSSVSVTEQRERLTRWIESDTDDEFVNAGMRELSSTGYLSNRMRQVVASYLVHDLGVNWIWGACYFQSQLIDYDPANNWGNWAYLAGALPGTPASASKSPVPARLLEVDAVYLEQWSVLEHRA